MLRKSEKWKSFLTPSFVLRKKSFYLLLRVFRLFENCNGLDGVALRNGENFVFPLTEWIAKTCGVLDFRPMSKYPPHTQSASIIREPGYCIEIEHFCHSPALDAPRGKNPFGELNSRNVRAFSFYLLRQQRSISPNICYHLSK